MGSLSVRPAQRNPSSRGFPPPPSAVAPRRRARSVADADAATSSGSSGDDAPAPAGGVSPEVRGVGPCEQARKALSLRLPFDGDEAACRDPLLPARVARWAAVGDVRKKHKKAQQPEAVAAVDQLRVTTATRSKALWDLVESYFREITLEDLEALEPNLPFSSNRLDPCFFIPFVGSGRQIKRNSDHTAVVAENTNLNFISVKESKELETNILHSRHATQVIPCLVGCNMQLIRNDRTNVEHYRQDMQEVILQQEEKLMEIELDQGTRDAVVLPVLGEDLSPSLDWLLGERARFVLTSERPNKKRKLLGADAGLKQLVLLPPLEVEAGLRCDVCCLGERDTLSNRMLHCNKCEVSVHQKCYGVQVVPDGYWTCTWCNTIRLARWFTRTDAGRTMFMPCMLCTKEKGALKPVKLDSGRTEDEGNLNFVHLFCSLWAPEVFVEDMESMEPVANIGNIQEKRTKMVCGICKVMHGACIRCSHGTCRACFHPICARESNNQMEIWGKFGDKNVEMRAFCSKHSTARSISSLHNDNTLATQQTAQVEVELDDAKQITDKKQQMRFTHKSREFMNCISSNLSSLNKEQMTELATLPSTVTRVESQQIQHTNMIVDLATGDGNLMSNSGDVSTVFGKLIDQGKAQVSDIESELVLSESLEAALVPETTTFFPGLKLKTIKLLQNSIHVPSVKLKSLDEDTAAPQGTLVRSESKNLTNSQLGSELEECVSSFDHCFPDGDNTNKDGSGSVENYLHTCHDCDEDNISGRCFLNVDGYHCYIHPFIEKMLQNWPVHISNQNKQAICYHEELSRSTHDQNHAGSSTKLEQLTDTAGADQFSKAGSSSILEYSSTKLEQLTDTAGADQLSKSGSLSILEYSPHDDIEGELVFLQSRLLSGVVAMKRRYEDFVFKIIHSLSRELDSFNKRKWDHIITNQFLRDIREAKKRGNTERRHKGAQAILAAAAPSVTFTSRNQSVNKLSENVLSAKQETIPKVNAGSSRISQLSLSPQAKDPSFSNSKVSSDTDFGIFDLAKFSKKNGFRCDVCMRCETVLNRIFLCSTCKAAVHLDCYQSWTNPTGPWQCELCQEMPSDTSISWHQSNLSGTKSCLVQCGLCHGTSGAFRKTTKGQWVHAFCAEWLLESSFRRGQYNAVHGVGNLTKGKDTCAICHHSVGTCLKCNTAACQVTFHPSCARDTGLHMITKKHGSLLRHKAYCGNHSVEQRKVDSLQYGPGEVMVMKQMRVELERLRLLCERIVKREKEKKELVVCEHDILATKSDSIASSRWASYYTSGPGASSESATTSVNNNSHSGKRQRSNDVTTRSDDVTVRSDDVTVDSTVSRKHTVRFSLHCKDTDRNTADSSTSTISYKRKLDEVESLTEKNLQERAAVSSHKSDGETKSAGKKNGETCQPELIISADKAMLCKQLPPKRLVYTRRSSLSKKNQQTQDVVQDTGCG